MKKTAGVLTMYVANVLSARWIAAYERAKDMAAKQKKYSPSEPRRTGKKEA